MFGGIDLNNPPDDEDFMPPEADVEGIETDGPEANFEHHEEVTEPGATFASMQTETENEPLVDAELMSICETTDTGAPTGHTLSSEDSGSDGEVQSTPEGFAPQKPFLGMKLDRKSTRLNSSHPV